MANTRAIYPTTQWRAGYQTNEREGKTKLVGIKSLGVNGFPIPIPSKDSTVQEQLYMFNQEDRQPTPVNVVNTWTTIPFSHMVLVLQH
jgi:hypothetical protein